MTNKRVYGFDYGAVKAMERTILLDMEDTGRVKPPFRDGMVNRDAC